MTFLRVLPFLFLSLEAMASPRCWQLLQSGTLSVALLFGGAVGIKAQDLKDPKDPKDLRTPLRTAINAAQVVGGGVLREPEVFAILAARRPYQALESSAEKKQFALEILNHLNGRVIDHSGVRVQEFRRMYDDMQFYLDELIRIRVEELDGKQIADRTSIKELLLFLDPKGRKELYFGGCNQNGCSMNTERSRPVKPSEASVKLVSDFVERLDKPKTVKVLIDGEISSEDSQVLQDYLRHGGSIEKLAESMNVQFASGENARNLWNELRTISKTNAGVDLNLRSVVLDREQTILPHLVVESSASVDPDKLIPFLRKIRVFKESFPTKNTIISVAPIAIEELEEIPVDLPKLPSGIPVHLRFKAKAREDDGQVIADYLLFKSAYLDLGPAIVPHLSEGNEGRKAIEIIRAKAQEAHSAFSSLTSIALEGNQIAFQYTVVLTEENLFDFLRTIHRLKEKANEAGLPAIEIEAPSPR